jgi:DNA invertase Pin-like site-specific DNA recombinase
MTTLIGWARVSTQDQSLELQHNALLDAGCSKVFGGKHSGVSNKHDDELTKLVDYVRDGDTVVVTKLDRLGRSLKQVLQTIDALKAKGVHLKALEQPIDTSREDAFSNAMLQLLGVFAEMERTFIVERTKAGREATGRKGGRPRKLCEEDRKKIRAKFRLGASKSFLSQKFGVSRLTIKRIVEET